jgi:S1-C subfamily serine protease
MTETDAATGQPDYSGLVPGRLGWKVTVATLAHRFFSLIHDSYTAGLISQPQDANKAGAWPVAYFNLYLQKIGVNTGGATDLGQMFAAMEHAGLLMRAGWRADMVGVPMHGQLYISQGVTSAQIQGSLWLSEVIGPELVIESYKAVTVQISGGEGRPSGTGLVLDRTHVLTNRHVVEGLVGPNLGAEITMNPSFKPPNGEWMTRPSVIRAHPKVDVAVIDTQMRDNEHLLALPGMVFRDPKWADDIRVFGYPYAGTTEQHISIERGDIVDQEAEAPAVGGYPRHKIFLTSAIARPGNSGGPIVAQDGRVVGLVVDHARDVSSSDGTQEKSDDAPGKDSGSPPFYRGIPAGEVVRAIEELGYPDLAVVENDRSA